MQAKSNPLFAPEWPTGEMSPTLAMRRLEYIDSHAPTGSSAAHPATIVANRVMGFDLLMRQRETSPEPGWASLPGDPATCVWCEHTSTRGDMTWFEAEDSRGWQCENESACRVRFEAL